MSATIAIRINRSMRDARVTLLTSAWTLASSSPFSAINGFNFLVCGVRKTIPLSEVRTKRPIPMRIWYRRNSSRSR